MNADEAALALRREQLLRRSEELRNRITADALAVSRHLHIADRAVGFLRAGGGRALLWGATALLLFGGPRRALKAVSRSALVWSFVRRWLPRILAFRRGSPRS